MSLKTAAVSEQTDYTLKDLRVRTQGTTVFIQHKFSSALGQLQTIPKLVEFSQAEVALS